MGRLAPVALTCLSAVRSRRLSTVVVRPGPAPEQLAERLHLTPRTLRRRLQERGQGFQSLLEEARHRDSRHLLASSDMEIQRISELLGFADPANFTRAFKGWMGMTPSQWRYQQAGQD